MGHILVFANILVITVGFIAMYQGIQVYRSYRFPAVRSFVILMALANSINLILLLMQYFLRNLTSLTPDGRFILVMVVQGSIGYILSGIAVGYFGSIVWELSGLSRAPRWSVYTYATLMSIHVTGIAVGCYRFFELGDRVFLRTVFGAYTTTFIIINAILVLLLFILSTTHQTQSRRALAMRFGILFGAISVSQIISQFVPPLWEIAMALLEETAQNVAFLLFTRSFIASFYGPIGNGIDHSLNRLCEEYRISSRERDLLKMIVSGKSNKEIEQELFISPHTVKNHIYSIFQKTGIKSRGQLVGLVLQRTDGTHTAIDS
jgi:DNA-binding CsgD family transcriptional regulator